MTRIEDNLARLRGEIAGAAKGCGRYPGSIALMAVSKTMPAEAIAAAYAAGQRLFGENRVQEFETKAAALGELADARFHLIGHLQSNKAAKAAALFAGVDAVDSFGLLPKLAAAAVKLGRRLPVLIEINVGGEAQKAGLAPEAGELDELLRRAPSLPAIEVRGLMCIPPHTSDPQGARPYFRRLRELRDRLAARHGVALPELSMGMSHDFRVAIEEGATCVRIGTAIFGSRGKP